MLNCVLMAMVLVSYLSPIVLWENIIPMPGKRMVAIFLAKVAKGLTKALAKSNELCNYWANLIVKNLESSYFP